MKLLEDVVLTDSIEIKTTPEKISEFLTGLVDDESYRAWHPDDHVALRWIKGGPWKEGSVVYAEEYIHGKLHKLKFVITKVVPLRIYFPKNTFTIEAKGESCIFTATACVRVGRIFKTLAKSKLEFGLSSVRKHMKEEGENLKKILEGEKA
jgi:hypothetical protein